MGAEGIKAHIKEEKVEYSSAPPGFKSLTSFTLKKLDDSEVMASEVASGSRLILMGTEDNIGDDASLTKSLRRRPWINYSEFDGSLQESEFKQVNENCIPRSLPKGVIRGCSECNNCQKVVAKWHPEDARRLRSVLGDAPVFHPTEEEFQDALKYIASIRPKAEKYGICRIVPPPSWNPPCPLDEKSIWENSKFATRVQRIDKLQNRDSTMTNYKIGIHESSQIKKRKYQEIGAKCTIGDQDIRKVNGLEGKNEAKPFCFESGPVFTLEAFQKYAEDFKSNYFGKDNNVVEGDHGSVQKKWGPSVEDIEGEYWRIVEKPTEEIEVLYGADVDTGVFGSGFPKVSPSRMVYSDDEEKYLKSDWNLSNICRLPSSVLSFEKTEISGVLVPWLYIGMCFSSFCWHVEDHYLYSLNYMHWGAPKMWYGVPGEDSQKFEAAMKKHLPDLFKEQPDLLHKLVTQLSPSILISESVPVYRCVQNPKEFVLTFPRAYHSGFNCGFNCAEAVNVAPVDWLPYGQHAVEIYREQCRKTTISHDKLLFGAAREAVRAQWELQLLRKNSFDNLRWKEVCGKDGILAKALKRRVEMESTRREDLSSSYSVKMDFNFDAVSERECVVCLYDLHLSAVGCQCCPEIFACLYHAKPLCTCALSEKTFLFRYTLTELNVLVEALEGKLSAIHRWAKLDLGLTLSSFVSKDKSQSPGSDSKSFKFSEETKQVNMVLDSGTSTSSGPRLCQEFKGPAVHVKEEPPSPNMANLSTTLQRNENKSTGCSLILKEIPLNKSVGGETNANKPLASEVNNIVLLSDDEDGNPVRRSPDKWEGDKLMGNSISQGDYKVQSLSRNSCSLESSGMGSGLDIVAKGPPGFSTLANAGHFPRYQQSYGSRKPDNENKDEKTGLHSDLTDSALSITGSSSRALNPLDIQKGPPIAKVVRRMNCIVKPLEFGVVCTGKLWSSSQAIYPKGFKSRVSYLSVLDPGKCCYYVSEILDAGLSRPLFMVKVETCPSEVFVHLSVTKCWDMVRNRVNEEILKQKRLGRLNLPPFQPKGSVDGLEMFGFLSPEVIKGLEATDSYRFCTEYWKLKAQTSELDRSLVEDPNLGIKKPADQAANPPDKVVLKGLFKKANTEELHSLHSVLGGDHHPGLVTQLLNEEIQGRSK